MLEFLPIGAITSVTMPEGETEEALAADTTEFLFEPERRGDPRATCSRTISTF